jgi:enhanced filamentous growth protein 1
MNQNQPYMDMHSSHMSSAQPYTPQSATAPGLSHYSQYQQPQVIQPGPTHYAPSPHSYGTYSYSNGVQSPQSATQPPSAHQVHPQALPLPGKLHVVLGSLLSSDVTLAMMPGPPSQHGYMGSGSAPGHGYGSQPQHQFDQTGQIAPPGMKPRVTATLWEDEGSLCFQVEAKGVCVARREGTMRSRPRGRVRWLTCLCCR